jgi:hypothetical protein
MRRAAESIRSELPTRSQNRGGAGGSKVFTVGMHPKAGSSINMYLEIFRRGLLDRKIRFYNVEYG